ncbi:MAG: cytochrome P450 [Myxococcota bacterium]|nr:cytochrome P450 [Myxococcota bacterium]
MELRSIAALTSKRAAEIPSGLVPPPRLSGGLPLVGHSIEFVRATMDLLFRANRELGEVAAFSVMGREMVAMFGPEAHEAVFRAPDAQLSPTEAYKIMTPVFGKDVVYDASPEKMAEQLKMLLPALKDRRMRTYGEAVVHETAESTSSWGESGVVDFVEFCRVLTNFTSSRCLLGQEFREGMSEEFARVYHDLEAGVTPLAYINAHLPVPSFRRRDKARVRMVEMITGVIRGRRAGERKGEDFLQTLMESKYSDGRDLTEDEITGLLLAGMFAGHHTSSVTTAWSLLELLQNPLQLQRCVAEIDRVFGDGRPVSHAALRELTFTEAVVKEALRMHPPLFMLVRVAQKDFTYKNYFVPKGAWIVLSPTVAHRIPEVFKDPDTFDPDRYLAGREEDKRDFAYIAFGGGRHKCLGNAFAILQIKAILALLLGQFDFGLCGDAIEANFQGLVIGPKEPCRVRYRRRAQPSVTMAMGSELAAMSKDAAAVAGTNGAEVNGANGGHVNGAAIPAEVAAAAKAAGCPAHAHAPQHTAPEATSPSLRVRIDRDLCQGHAVCVGEAPEVFAISPNDGKVMLKVARPSAELHAKVRAAAEHCPTRSIRIEE